MITPDEFASLMLTLSDPDFEPTEENLNAAIGHLHGDDELLLLAVVGEIHEARIVEMKIDAERWKRLQRLAAAAGCPKDVKVLPWLQERGLVEQVEGGGWRIKAAKPRAVTE
jgi:hypothetical protein